MRVILMLTILVSFPIWNFSQQSDPDQKEFVQFMMTNLPSKAKAVEIDNFYRSQSGVFIARADINSKKFLVIYYSDSGLTVDQITSWMEELDITYKCVRHGIHGIDVIIDQKMDCE